VKATWRKESPFLAALKMALHSSWLLQWISQNMGNIADRVLDDNASSLVWSLAGASGNAQLTPDSGKVEAMKLDFNTNLMSGRSSISTVKQKYCYGESGEDMRIMVAVFAIRRKHAWLPG
jgi:hypothetical protein